MSRSLAQACALAGAEFVIASPEGYGLERRAERRAIPQKRSKARTSSTPTSGCRWAARTATSAAQAFEPYQVDEALMALRHDAWFLHCLPARRGEEVTAPVIDGPRSARLAAGRRTGCTRRAAPMLWMLEEQN